MDLLYASVARESSVLVLVEWTYYMQVLLGKVVFWYLWNGPIICKCCQGKWCLVLGMDLLYASVARESSVLVLGEWTYYMQVLPGKVVFWYLWNGPIICKCS